MFDLGNGVAKGGDHLLAHFAPQEFEVITRVWIRFLSLQQDRVLTDGAVQLPWHRAVKKVPHVDLHTGRRVEPNSPNGVKFETFVFDALPLAESSIVYETDRVEEFAPIKNATGVDSVESSHRLQSDRAGRWLEAHGVKVARDGKGRVAARIEISPLTALEPADLVAVDLPAAIAADEEILL